MTLGALQRVISTLDITPLAAAPERGFCPSLVGFQRKALLGRWQGVNICDIVSRVISLDV